MFRTSSLRLITIFGIRIGVHASWFLVLFLFLFLLADSFTAAMGGDSTAGFGVAAGATLLFFTSIVLHELGHALAARRSGIEVNGIDLIFFGGVMRMNRDTDTPWSEFKVAVAGPVVTLALIILVAAIGIPLSGPDEFWRAAWLEEETNDVPSLLVSFLVTMNCFLLLFNLIPAFPLDGGRIARSIAWKLTGSRTKATKFAARIGQGFAYILIALGLALAIRSALIDGIWLMLLGWFLAQAAKSAVLQSEVAQRLAQVSVSKIMDSAPIVLHEETTLDEAQTQFARYYTADYLPLVDKDERYVGLVERKAAETAGSQGTIFNLGEGAIRDEGIVVGLSSSLEDLIAKEALHKRGMLVVLDDDRHLRGTVSSEDVARALRDQVGQDDAGN